MTVKHPPPAEKKKTFVTFKYKFYLFAILIAIATVFLLIANVEEVTFQTRDLKLSWSKADNYQYEDLSDKGYFIKTEGCTIPGFEPFDDAILRYVERVSPILCYNSSTAPLVKSNITHIWIIEDNLKNYDIIDLALLSCCYRPFYRPPASSISRSDNRHRYEYYCTNFTEPVQVRDEFVRVECSYNASDIYKDFHSFVNLKPKSIEANEKEFSVLVLGIDAVSRLNFIRTMPETVRWLKNIGAVDFKGYNKVGDNTYPNLIPVLSGLNVSELSSKCLLKSSYFDKCPFIWNTYEERGYYTALAEDAANIGVFNYLKKGFSGTPTDYYWRTFNYLAEEEIGHEKRLNSKLCIGPWMTIDVLLQYTNKFVKTMKDHPYFGFFWETSLTHDNLNYPMLADEKYVTLLGDLYSDGLLNKTILIVLSDHGIRWGGIRSTYQGRMEERLPFLFIALPEAFKSKYPLAASNLQSNAKKLTTPYDLHETLVDIINSLRLEDKAIRLQVSNPFYKYSRGISLFLPVTTDRTCQSADIEPHWCTCHDARKLDVNDVIVNIVANLIVKHINSMLDGYMQCAKLNLTKILDARIAEAFNSSQVSGVDHMVQDYTVVVHTEPGGGLFEATVRQSIKGWNVTGTVSRINLYGMQSRCVDNYRLKLYCYCDSLVAKLNIFR